MITKYNLQTDDVLRRMELTRNSNPLDANALKQALTLLDPSLDGYKALKLSKELLKNKSTLEIQELTDILGCPPGIILLSIYEYVDDPHEHSDWYHSQLLRIKRKLKDTKRLQDEFEVQRQYKYIKLE